MTKPSMNFHDIRMALERNDYISEDLLSDSKTSNALARMWIRFKKILGHSKEYNIDKVSKKIMKMYNNHGNFKIKSDSQADRIKLKESLDEFEDMLMITRLLRKKLGLTKFSEILKETLKQESNFLKEAQQHHRDRSEYTVDGADKMRQKQLSTDEEWHEALEGWSEEVEERLESPDSQGKEVSKDWPELLNDLKHLEEDVLDNQSFKENILKSYDISQLNKEWEDDESKI